MFNDGSRKGVGVGRHEAFAANLVVMFLQPFLQDQGKVIAPLALYKRLQLLILSS